MSLLLYPLAAMAGGLIGVIAHETTHAVAAVAVGELVGVGWQGGVVGGPYVDFRAPTRWRSEVVRKAPLVVGVGAAVALVAAYRGPSPAWVAAAGAVAGLLWTSPEDVSRARAQASAAD